MSDPQWWLVDKIKQLCQKLSREQLEELYELIKRVVEKEESIDAAIESYNKEKEEND